MNYAQSALWKLSFNLPFSVLVRFGKCAFLSMMTDNFFHVTDKFWLHDFVWGMLLNTNSKKLIITSHIDFLVVHMFDIRRVLVRPD